MSEAALKNPSVVSGEAAKLLGISRIPIISLFAEIVVVNVLAGAIICP